MHILCIAASKDEIQPPTMEGLETLIAVSILPFVPCIFKTKLLTSRLILLASLIKIFYLQKTKALSTYSQPESNG